EGKYILVAHATSYVSCAIGISLPPGNGNPESRNCRAKALLSVQLATPLARRPRLVEDLRPVGGGRKSHPVLRFHRIAFRRSTPERRPRSIEIGGLMGSPGAGSR